MMGLTVHKLTIWIGGLPYVIGALTEFAASPYGLSKGGLTCRTSSVSAVQTHNKKGCLV